MTLILYYHPFSSYCQKALMALHEKGLGYEAFQIDLGDPRQRAEFAAIWPYAKFPVLQDTTRNATIPEASLIVEHADRIGNVGPRLLPEDPADARNVRLLDRILDNYLHTPMQKIVGDRLRPADQRDPFGVEEARTQIAATCKFLESRLGEDGWMGGSDLNLGDCAAAPPLFYVAKLAPLTDYPRLAQYLVRAMERPSFRRCLDDAREYRAFFPGDESDGPWPDEDKVLAF